MSALGKIWKYRKEILDGVANTVVKKAFVETVYAHRLEICKECEEWDGDCLVPGSGPCCGACGCSGKFKLRSMSSVCGLAQKGKEPKWFPVLSQKHDDEFLGDLDDESTNSENN